MEAQNGVNGSPALPQNAESTNAPANPNDRISESIKLEHQLIKVPYEYLKTSMRANNRMVENEVTAVVASVAEAVDHKLSKEEAMKHLTSLVSRLQGLKRKLDESNKNEQLQVQRSRARLDHLSALKVAEKDLQATWYKVKVDRILVDYMLRSSYYSTASKLAESSNIEELCDIDIFLDARKVVDALRDRDCSEALQWCAENKLRLRKNKSVFEFKVRLQEFIELVRQEKMMDAIMYARKHLAPWGRTNMKELQQAMATLAFQSTTDCASYKVLFDAKQWDNLIEQFKQEFFKFHGMTLDSLLHIHLQAGLLALKTPFCYDKECTKEDPLSNEIIRQIAEPLPYAKHIRSKLVCYITKELMDEDNPPLVLPNGYVYSRKALEEMAKKNNGRITCPRTGDTCSFSELSKAYIS